MVCTRSAGVHSDRLGAAGRTFADPVPLAVSRGGQRCADDANHRRDREETGCESIRNMAADHFAASAHLAARPGVYTENLIQHPLRGSVSTVIPDEGPHFILRSW